MPGQKRQTRGEEAWGSYKIQIVMYGIALIKP